MSEVTFDIDKHYTDGSMDEIVDDPENYTTSVSVCDYEDIRPDNKFDNFEVIDPDEIVTKENTIRIMFSYPLTKHVSFKFKSPTGNGFTRMEFFKVVFDGYTKIYKTEEEDDKDPGNIPGMANRMTSEGRYGIWGHVIQDLCIERITDKGNGNFELSIGS